jgi:hypothetical protein
VPHLEVFLRALASLFKKSAEFPLDDLLLFIRKGIAANGKKLSLDSLTIAGSERDFQDIMSSYSHPI